MSMARRAPARRPKHSAGDVAPRSDVVRLNLPARTSGGFTTFLESATQEILAVTYWFDPAPHAEPYPVTVRFSGRRVDVKGRLQAGDRFVQNETIEQVVPGSGPIALTARVRGINAGEWVVTAYMLGSAHPAHGSPEQENASSEAGPLPPVARWWRKWAPDAQSVEPVRTCLAPLARVPGRMPGIWGAMVTLGMVVALALQALVISASPPS
jgi:phosphatidylglycerol---prolipoprotein diacylglyceryl transferase